MKDGSFAIASNELKFGAADFDANESVHSPSSADF
jgi:hypothetical protein